MNGLLWSAFRQSHNFRIACGIWQHKHLPSAAFRILDSACFVISVTSVTKAKSPFSQSCYMLVSQPPKACMMVNPLQALPHPNPAGGLRGGSPHPGV